MWQAFIDLLTNILSAIEGAVGDWGLAIIILTAIIRIILSPLTIKATRSSAQMQVLQPRLKEIQEKYADDPAKQQEAIQEFYAHNHFNPLGGCLPIFLQMPIFFALFSVLKQVEGSFYTILPSLSVSPADAFAQWGLASAWVYIALDVLFGILTLVPMMMNSMNSDQEQAKQTKIMGAVMAVMMVYFGWTVPVGVVLYYNVSSIVGVIQQQFITKKIMEKAKAEEEERLLNAPIQVDVVRKEKKNRPRKKA
ncbi:MAG: YidC/Oxa1 family membrane protein insertase [Atopobiaceae bacterium]|jgi:YidC/Oxa1 family membrane protein insertase|nr:YidC/Oxa1 family membrane protein insertase [Atopobiaceae bacterium]